MIAVGIIPARYAATRFPGKVLAPIQGYPMVHHVYQRSSQCTSLKEVIIATDSSQVAEACTLLGDRVMLTGSEHESGTDRVAEAARNYQADLIVNIQADEPKLDPGIVDQLVVYMDDNPELSMGTVGSTTLDPDDVPNPNVVKVIGRDGLAVGFYRQLPSPLPEGDVLRHLGLYAYRREFLFKFTDQPPSHDEQKFHLEQLRAVDMGTSIGLVVVDFASMAVDTPNDLEQVVTTCNG
ncbi:MAG: 3-deoxy-manno-octulosonate cytidylyltransferase [Fidelibacterota bacterium]|nr:MAG: 3-deoxy-manno-octulosonate cytidylyltransferase [Candidatus Neomarinimicrobiota bacterium]